MEELFPCPFCGNPAMLDEIEEVWFISCTVCQGGTAGTVHREHIIANWNCRVWTPDIRAPSPAPQSPTWEQLDEAIDLIDESLPYVPEYFRSKWNLDKRYEILMESVKAYRRPTPPMMKREEE